MSTASSVIETNLLNQGPRGITGAKLIETLNSIIGWVDSPALKRLTTSQVRGLTEDYPNLVQVSDQNGLFSLDSADGSSADDSLNVLVTVTGKRYKRVIISVGSVSGLQSSLSDKAPVNNPEFTGVVKMPSQNINTRRVANVTELNAIVAANNFIGQVWVDVDSTNDNKMSLYSVYNNIKMWVAAEIKS